MHIQIIIGSIRQGRRAKPVGDWAYQMAVLRQDLSVELVDLKDWDLPMFDLPKPPILGGYEDPLQKRWADKIAEGDGYLFVSPEYNHGYTSVLKNALDYIFGEWGRKPASFISYGGALGARAIEQLRLVLIELRMAPLADALHISDIRSKFKDERFEGDARDAKQLTKVLDELVWWGNALKGGRQ
jgi:NAD(P)H-dependent FMN reductase